MILSKEKQKLWKTTILLLIGSLAFWFCGKREDSGKNDKEILAKIADREISVAEFLHRAEYTIRPPYAKGNTNLHKNIIFNSLVGEKLLAVEAGNDCPLLQNEYFRAYIEGRKEQAMRELMFIEEGKKKVKMNPAEIQEVFSVAGRTYRVQYVGFSSRAEADSFVASIKVQSGSIEQFIRRRTSDITVPEREVKFDSPVADILHKALFSHRIEKGQLIGPIRVQLRYYMVLQVKGYTDSPAITETEVQQRMEIVKETLKQLKAKDIYTLFLMKLMHGKKLLFEPDVFHSMLNILKPFYFMKNEDRKRLLIRSLFKQNQEMQDSLDFRGEYQRVKMRPFFTYDGQVWTVERFVNELRKHPLVFRERHFSSSQFPEQLRLAIADLLRDREITKEAYRRGYDRNPEVVRYTKMWKDALVAQYQVEQYLKRQGIANIDTLDTVRLIKKYLDPYLSRLRDKYQEAIEVNVPAYDSIKLTRIDMFAWQYNVPFPTLVPAFPQITLYERLNYGNPMPSPP